MGKRRNDTQSSDELIPALAHLNNAQNANGNDTESHIVDYIYEEQTFEFDTKPMGSQIEAENGNISVRSVRAMSTAGQYGVKEKWDIVAVNGFRDWSSMLGILESSLGPFTIIFAVPTQITQSLEKSLSQSNQHPIVPSQISQKQLASAPEDEEIPAVNQQNNVNTISISELPISPMQNDEMDLEEYNRNKQNFNMMQRNSSAIAKQVLDEHEDDEMIEIKTVQTKNAELLETLQVIRLKGEMERIELLNAKNVQIENQKLKKEINTKVKPLKGALKNA